MAISTVKELLEGVDGSLDARGQRQYTRVFSVRTDSDDDGPATILAAASLPGVFGTYVRGNDADRGALVTDIKVNDDGWRKWLVTVSYSSNAPPDVEYDPTRQPDGRSPSAGTPGSSSSGVQNPVNRVPEVRWSVKKIQKPMVVDASGKLIVSSSNEVFDPPIEAEVTRQVLTIQRYESAYSPALSQEYANTTNSDRWLGYEPGRVLCYPFEGERQYENNQYCWRVRYEFEFSDDPEGFATLILDRGYVVIDEDTGEPTKIFHDDGSHPSAPVLLNGNGKKLSSCKSTISTAADATQDYLLVDSNLPFVGMALPFYARVGLGGTAETVKVTALDGSIGLLVERGQQDTAATEHAEDDVVQAMPIYLSFTKHRSAIFADLRLL